MSVSSLESLFLLLFCPFWDSIILCKFPESLRAFFLRTKPPVVRTQPCTPSNSSTSIHKNPNTFVHPFLQHTVTPYTATSLSLVMLDSGSLMVG